MPRALRHTRGFETASSVGSSVDSRLRGNDLKIPEEESKTDDLQLDLIQMDLIQMELIQMELIQMELIQMELIQLSEILDKNYAHRQLSGGCFDSEGSMRITDLKNEVVRNGSNSCRARRLLFESFEFDLRSVFEFWLRCPSSTFSCGP